MMRNLSEEDKVSNLTVIAVILFLAGLMITVVSMSGESKVKKLESPKKDSLVLTDSCKFSPERLKYALKLYNIKHAEIVYKQAILETGNFKSPIFKENNNLFGMKHPCIRRTTSKGKHRGHAKYESWLDSVRDMAYFQKFYYFRLQRQNYYEFLDQVYATDDSYSIKLKQISI